MNSGIVRVHTYLPDSVAGSGKPHAFLGSLSGPGWNLPEEMEFRSSDPVVIGFATGSSAASVDDRSTLLVAQRLAALGSTEYSQIGCEQLLEAVNADLLSETSRDDRLLGMSVSAVGLRISGSRISIFEVGGGTILEFRDGYLIRLSDPDDVFGNSQRTGAISGFGGEMRSISDARVENSTLTEDRFFLICSERIDDENLLERAEVSLREEPSTRAALAEIAAAITENLSATTAMLLFVEFSRS